MPLNNISDKTAYDLDLGTLTSSFARDAKEKGDARKVKRQLEFAGSMIR